MTEKSEDAAAKTFEVQAETPESVKPAQYATPTKKTPKINPANNEYLVRLMTVSNTAKFNEAEVDDLGAVEKRKAENGMSIILVGRYPDVETAVSIQNELRNRGFDQCYVVRDEKGKLNRIK